MVDRDYWNEFYKKAAVPTNCSTFAASVLKLIHPNEPLFELGCGNGRDAFYFAEHGIPVVASDLAQDEMDELNKKSKNQNPQFVPADFTALPSPYFNDGRRFATVYSRFTLHAVREEGASSALKWAWENLQDGGILLIEVRSIKDKLCGQGTKVEGERDAWITNHYRRFIRKDELLNELQGLGFSIEYCLEQDGISVWKDDDPVVIRVHARKSLAKK